MLTPLEIYKQGVEAKANGMPESANPYEYPSKEWTYWWDGWMAY